MASDDRIDILWAARGGYGASRLLPILDQITQARGKPKRKKLLVGFIATVIAVLAAKVLGRLPMYRRTNPDLKVPVAGFPVQPPTA
jgi:hypothetical protein